MFALDILPNTWQTKPYATLTLYDGALRTLEPSPHGTSIGTKPVDVENIAAPLAHTQFAVRGIEAEVLGKPLNGWLVAEITDGVRRYYQRRSEAAAWEDSASFANRIHTLCVDQSRQKAAIDLIYKRYVHGLHDGRRDECLEDLKWLEAARLTRPVALMVLACTKPLSNSTERLEFRNRVHAIIAQARSVDDANRLLAGLE